MFQTQPFSAYAYPTVTPAYVAYPQQHTSQNKIAYIMVVRSAPQLPQPPSMQAAPNTVYQCRQTFSQPLMSSPQHSHLSQPSFDCSSSAALSEIRNVERLEALPPPPPITTVENKVNQRIPFQITPQPQTPPQTPVTPPQTPLQPQTQPQTQPQMSQSQTTNESIVVHTSQHQSQQYQTKYRLLLTEDKCCTNSVWHCPSHDCDIDFKSQNSLLTHYRKHTEFAFVCDYCHKSFSKRSNLTQHVRIHTKEKPFKCDQCDFESSQKHSLKAHLLTHSGEKPFQCQYCQRRFSQKHNMNKHIKAIHLGVVYRCNVCAKELHSKQTHTNHMKNHLS